MKNLLAEWFDPRSGRLIRGVFKDIEDVEAYSKKCGVMFNGAESTDRQDFGIEFDGVIDTTSWWENLREWAGDYRSSGRD